MGVLYATLEDIARAVDFGASLRIRRQVARLLEESSRATDTLCSRPPEAFVPTRGTWRYDWPDDNQGSPYRLYLGPNPLVEVESITSGGTALTAGQYIPGPSDGPPYTYIEIDRSGAGAWSSGDTSQQAIAIVGTRAWSGSDRAVGTLAATAAAGAGTLTVNAAAAAEVGVGSVLLVGTERMDVGGRSYIDTTADTTADLTASRAGRSVAVTNGTLFAEGEQIMIDTERMVIDSIAGNVLAVDRAVDGSALAAHASGASVYASRLLSVRRGILGTTAAEHASGAGVSVYDVPGPARRLTVAYTLVALAREGAAFAQTEGSGGETSRTTPGGGIKAAEESCYWALGRRVRHRAV